MMLLMRAVRGCIGRKLGCAAFLSGRGCSRTAGWVSHTGLPARAAPAMPTAAATAPAATSLATFTATFTALAATVDALTTLDAVSGNLALIASACLNVGARLATL